MFGAMDASKAQFRVLDWGLSSATLEEVFINNRARQRRAERQLSDDLLAPPQC